MRTFKNWLITDLLKKDKLVAVPEKWQVDYVKTASNNVKNTQAIVSLIKEYNELIGVFGCDSEIITSDQLDVIKKYWGHWT